MRHLEPQQIAPEKKGIEQQKKTSVAGWVAIAITVTLGLGAFGTWILPAGRVDRVTQQERTARQDAFTHVSSMAVSPVANENLGSALEAMKLQPVDRAKLRQLLVADPGQKAASPLKLVSMTLWDTHDEDGDVVAVVSAGYRREIVLTNAPQTISFPVDSASIVQVIGVHDGGGGITLGISSPAQQVLMPIMSEGQALTLPVAY